MDLIAATKSVSTIASAAHAAGTVNGDAVDTAGFKDVKAVVNSGTNVATGTADIKIQESDNGSTGWADITGAAFTQITTANDNAVYTGRVRMTPSRKRYLRAVAVVANAACALSVTFELGDAKQEPVSQANTIAFDVCS